MHNLPWLSKTARRPTTWHETRRYLRLVAAGAALLGLLGWLQDTSPSQDAQLELQTAAKWASTSPLLLW